MDDQELEVKYYVLDLAALEERIQKQGAVLVQPRVHELNLRFDKSDMELSRMGRALRLRQDEQVRLTYKGPSLDLQGARLRQEIEFSVSDYDSARAFLEALGFQVIVIYEKYRTTYDWQGAHLSLDQLPYGNFIEIEGFDAAVIKEITSRLELDWEARIPESYTVIFEQLKNLLHLSFRDLIFENFQTINAPMELLNIHPAD